MRRGWSSLGLLILLLAFCVFASLQIQNRLTETEEFLSMAMTLTEQNRNKEAEAELAKAAASWHTIQRTWDPVLNHDKTEQLKYELNHLQCCFSQMEPAEKQYELLEVLQKLQQLKHAELPELQNIL